MNFKLNKTDIYLLLVYYAFAIPLSMVDYADYENKWLLPYEVLLSLIFDVSTVYIVVFVLFPRFFFKRKYVTFFIIMVVLLVTVGYLWLNAYCLVAECTGNRFGIPFIYAGFVIVAESVGIMAAIFMAKKLFDAQLDYARLEKEKAKRKAEEKAAKAAARENTK